MSEPEPKRWVLLIGADFYMTGNARTDHDGRTIHYHNLGGCVNDVALVETFLRDDVGVPSGHIVKLTSSPPLDVAQNNTPRGDAAKWPTYWNIKQAFRDLLARAERGDFVYIHYSGHGARVRTAYPDLKGPGGFDEALVPVDIEILSPTRPPSRYIRDIEIAGWMRDFVDKDLRVTIVLDSCHAGSSNRSSGDTRTRGIAAVDRSLLPQDLPVHGPPPDDRPPPPPPPGGTVAAAGSRGGRLRRNWLLEASGYVLLGACTAYQRAQEFRPAERVHGLLSYYLVESLRSGHALLSPSCLLGRLIAKVQSHIPSQTPILDGCGGGAAFLGIRTLSTTATSVCVLAVDRDRNSVELDHGDLHGVHVGAEYGLHNIHENAAQPFAARVRITEVRGLTSVAQIILAQGSNQPAIQTGWIASLVQPAREKLNVVRVISSEATARHPNYNTGLKHLRGLLEDQRYLSGRLWHPMADGDGGGGGSGGEAADFSVRISEDGCYELLDATLTSVPNLPRLPIVDAASGDRLLHALDHLSRFRLLGRLSADPTTVLRTPCRFELLGKSTSPPLDPPDDGPADLVFPEGLEPVEPVNGTYTVKHEEIICIRFKNVGGATVYFAVFNLKPLWGVEKLYPGGDGWAEPVGPGEERVLPIQMEIPPSLRGGQTAILDTFKAVVTTRETPLGVFELPELIHESKRGCPASDFWASLDSFLQASYPDSRDTTLKKRQSHCAWQVYDIRIQTVSES